METRHIVRPLLLNSEDRRGGAARAAYRLHIGLKEIGVPSQMLVQVKHGDDPSVFGPRGLIGHLLNPLRPALDLLPLIAYGKRERTTYYPGWLSSNVRGRVREINPDLVHLHWVTGGFLNVRSLRRFGLPVVWTLHDMWAFTGGCHYDDGCTRHETRCGACPVLGSRARFDLSFLNWRRKAHAYQRLSLSVVTPSRWLGDRARRSALLSGFPVHVIPNGLDTSRFRPLGKDLARQLLGLPPDRNVILFGALHATSDARKGFRELQVALQHFAASSKSTTAVAVIFGASRPERVPDFGMRAIYHGICSDDLTLAALYSAADVFVAPSLQENLSNTVMEALACGTPCVAFEVGGMPDMIRHRRNGYLVTPFDAAGLAAGIQWVIERNAGGALSACARQTAVEEFDIGIIARRYAELYEAVLQERGVNGAIHRAGEG